MSRLVLSESDFLLLRSKVDEAINDLWLTPMDTSLFPVIEGVNPTIETVSVNELLLATLSAIAKATRKLRESNIAMDMSSNPMEIKFTGTIVGVSKNQGEIYLKLNN